MSRLFVHNLFHNQNLIEGSHGGTANPWGHVSFAPMATSLQLPSLFAITTIIPANLATHTNPIICETVTS